MKKQYDSLDILKFLLSLCIVAIHSGFLGSAIYPFVRLAVPAFFIISGFFAYKKINSAQSGSEKTKIMWGIIRRYFLLYLFWFILLFPVTVLIRGYFNQGILQGLLTIIRSFFVTSTFQGSWYLMACMQGIILVHFLSKKLSNRIILLISLPFYLFATFTSKYALLINQNPTLSALVPLLSGPFPSPCGSAMICTLYIALGKAIAEGFLEKTPLRHCLLGFAVSISALFIEFGLASQEPFFAPSCDCWVMLAPAALYLTVLALKLKITFQYSLVLRKISTLVYCSHMAIIFVADILFYKLNISDQHGILLFSTALLSSLAMSAFFLYFEKFHSFRFLRYAH